MGLIARHQVPVRILQRASDPLIVAVALWAICQAYGIPYARQYQVLLVLAALVVAVVFRPAGVYRPWRTAPVGEELRRILVAWTLVAGVLLALAYSTKTGDLFSRRVVLTWLVLAPVAVSAFHLGVRLSLRYARSRGRNTKTYVIVGGGPVARRIHEQLSAHAWLGMRAVGLFDDGAPDPGMPVPYLGKLADAAEFVKSTGTNCVYVPLSNTTANPGIRSVVESLGDTTASVYVVPDIFTFQLLNATVEHLDGMPLIALRETPFDGIDGWVKRVEDVVLAWLILIIIAPVLVAVAVGIKLTSPGPVIFKQRRYGLDGREMRVYKFRTMRVCEDGPQIAQARREDDRITPFGAFLRRTSMDELPQFVNVLQGKMSIVGPRPHAVAHNEQYRRLIKGYMLRHKVRPGITGLAQVNGYRGETETLEKMEKRVEYDLAYIERWSLALDLRIILQTVVRAFGRPEAY